MKHFVTHVAHPWIADAYTRHNRLIRLITLIVLLPDISEPIWLIPFCTQAERRPKHAFSGILRYGVGFLNSSRALFGVFSPVRLSVAYRNVQFMIVCSGNALKLMWDHPHVRIMTRWIIHANIQYTIANEMTFELIQWLLEITTYFWKKITVLQGSFVCNSRFLLGYLLVNR